MAVMSFLSRYFRKRRLSVLSASGFKRSSGTLQSGALSISPTNIFSCTASFIFSNMKSSSSKSLMDFSIKILS